MATPENKDGGTFDDKPIEHLTKHYRVLFYGPRNRKNVCDTVEFSLMLEQLYSHLFVYFDREKSFPTPITSFGEDGDASRESGLEHNEHPRFVVHVHLTRKEYIKHLCAVEKINFDSAMKNKFEGGSFSYISEEVYMWKQRSKYFTRQLLLHECTHQYHFCLRLRRTYSQIRQAFYIRYVAKQTNGTDPQSVKSQQNVVPITNWYIEGLAEFFGMHNWDSYKGSLVVGTIPGVSLSDYPARVLKVANSFEVVQNCFLHWVCNDRLYCTDDLEVDGSVSPLPRSLAWSICHFFIHCYPKEFTALTAIMESPVKLELSDGVGRVKWDQYIMATAFEVAWGLSKKSTLQDAMLHAPFPPERKVSKKDTDRPWLPQRGESLLAQLAVEYYEWITDIRFSQSFEVLWTGWQQMGNFYVTESHNRMSLIQHKSLTPSTYRAVVQYSPYFFPARCYESRNNIVNLSLADVLDGKSSDNTPNRFWMPLSAVLQSGSGSSGHVSSLLETESDNVTLNPVCVDACDMLGDSGLIWPGGGGAGNWGHEYLVKLGVAFGVCDGDYLYIVQIMGRNPFYKHNLCSNEVASTTVYDANTPVHERKLLPYGAMPSKTPQWSVRMLRRCGGGFKILGWVFLPPWPTKIEPKGNKPSSVQSCLLQWVRSMTFPHVVEVKRTSSPVKNPRNATGSFMFEVTVNGHKLEPVRSLELAYMRAQRGSAQSSTGSSGSSGDSSGSSGDSSGSSGDCSGSSGDSSGSTGDSSGSTGDSSSVSSSGSQTNSELKTQTLSAPLQVPELSDRAKRGGGIGFSAEACRGRFLLIKVD